MVATNELALRVLEIVAILMPLMVIIFQLLIRYIQEDLFDDYSDLQALGTFFMWAAVALTGTGGVSTVILYISTETIRGGLLMALMYVTALLVGGLIIAMGIVLRRELAMLEPE